MATTKSISPKNYWKNKDYPNTNNEKFWYYMDSTKYHNYFFVSGFVDNGRKPHLEVKACRNEYIGFFDHTYE